MTLLPVNDGDVEGAETVILTLGAGLYQIGTPSTATATIADNVTVVTISGGPPP